VSNIAAATSRNFDFAQHLAAFFENEDAGTWAGLCKSDGSKKTCCATSGYYEIIVGRMGVGAEVAHEPATMPACGSGPRMNLIE
jgi:hypothetical protein